jgi:lipopolysaccharide export system permease protein
VSLLDRYLAKEILLPFGAGVLFLTQILVATQVLSQAEILFGSGVGARDVLTFVLLLTPNLLGFVLPIAFILGAVVGLGRLAEDREIIAIGAAGLSPVRLVRVPLAIAVAVSALALALAFQVEPAAHRSARQLLNEIIKRNVSNDVKSGVFYDDLPGYTIYAEKAHAGRWENVVISDRSDPGAPVLLLARKGRFAPAPVGEAMRLALEVGEIHREAAEEDDYAVAGYDRAELLVNVRETVGSRNRVSSLVGATAGELLAGARAEPGTPQARKMLGYLHKKIAQAIAFIPFALLTVPLAAWRRGGRAFAAGTAAAVVLVHFLLLRGGEVMAQRGALPAALALQISTLALTVAGLAALAALGRRGTGAVR